MPQVECGFLNCATIEYATTKSGLLNLFEYTVLNTSILGRQGPRNLQESKITFFKSKFKYLTGL